MSNSNQLKKERKEHWELVKEYRIQNRLIDELNAENIILRKELQNLEFEFKQYLSKSQMSNSEINKIIKNSKNHTKNVAQREANLKEKTEKNRSPARNMFNFLNKTGKAQLY
jgi:hypothetical protein